MNDKKNKTLMVVLGIFALVIVTTAISFAYFTYSRTSETKTTITTGDLQFSYFERKNSLDIVDQYPLSDTIGAKDEANAYSFQVGMNSTSAEQKMNYDVVLVTNNTGANTFTNDQIKYNISRDGTYLVGDGETGVKLSTINGLNAGTSTGEGIALKSQLINSGETHNYKLRIWISDDVSYTGTIDEATGTMTGRYNSNTYSLKVRINASQEVKEKDINLYNMMKTLSLGDESTLINYSEHSGISNTNGIYMTTKTEGNIPVYFYRGNVDNNVIFNNMCWKIIRTTETGGIKLIYNGVPTEVDGNKTCKDDGAIIGTSAFNTLYDDNAYAGYMYGTPDSTTYEDTHKNTTSSTIKIYIDDWYSKNFSLEVTSKIEDTIFCNDRSTVAGGDNNIRGSEFGVLGYGKNNTGYGALSRATYWTTNPNPTYICQQKDDKFSLKSTQANYNENLNGNELLDYPVGLITLDEVVFAGLNTYESNKDNYKNDNYYLHSKFHFFTMSPVFMYNNQILYMGFIHTDGYMINYYNPNVTHGVRPVVSLISGTIAEAGGTGTTDNPFVIK